MKIYSALISAACLTAVGCASSADNVQPSYVSPLTYQNHTCNQIAQEARRISRRVAEVSNTQDKNATNDAVVTGVAIVVFLPAAFFLEGDGQTAAELGRLKGELEALEKASVKRGCNIKFTKPKKKKEEFKPDWQE